MVFGIEYIFTCLLALLYTLFVSGYDGTMFLTVLIIMPIISIIATRLMLKNIRYTVTSVGEALDKGNRAEYRITFTKKGFLPSPYIAVGFFNSAHFEAKSDRKFLFTLSSKNHVQTLECQYEAAFFGRGELGLEYIGVRDFFGFKTYSLYDMKTDEEKKYISRFDIYPRLDTGRDASELVRYLSEETLTDEEEETASTVMYGGVPGFEHKEYEPGDPLRMVNWKLSAKKDQLMVRLSEKPTTTKVSLVLDFSYSDGKEPDAKSLLEARETVAEALISAIEIIVGMGNRCNVFFREQSGFTHFSVCEEADLPRLQQRLCAVVAVPCGDDDAIPFDEIKKTDGSKRIAVFTTEAGAAEKSLSGETGRDYDIQIVAYWAEELRAEGSAGNFWVIDHIGPIRRM